MVKVILGIVAVIACPLLWTMIIVPLIGRWFRVPIKIGALPIDGRDPRLSKWQSFWIGGVLGWGIGLFLMGALTARFIDDTRTTIPKLLYGLAGELIIGGLLSQSDWTYPLDNE
ncbi:MAG: hypothetical protein ABSD72_11075 [Terracidiphilus sp.]|jgi:hypothetical protein